MAIPFNIPPVVGREMEYVSDALQRRHLSGDGFYTTNCQNILLQMVGGSIARLTHSCTAALEMAAILCDAGPGDEIIMPSFTFVSTANAFVLRGATPVFVDIRPDTMNIDEARIEAAVTPRTKAIVVVHYAGVCCEMDAIQAIADRHGLLIVEDAAQALLSSYEGRPAGSLSAFSCFSFHETKNIVSGEGGAIVVKDSRFADRADIIREKGTNRVQFKNRVVDKYTWLDIGSSYLPNEVTAACLLAQLEVAQDLTNTRLQIWKAYHQAFEHLEAEGRVRRPVIPANCTHNGHMYYLILRDRADRDSFIAHLGANGVLAPFHYVPLHTSPAGLKWARAADDMAVTNDVSSRLVRLPLFNELGEKQAQVIDLAKAWLEES